MEAIASNPSLSLQVERWGEKFVLNRHNLPQCVGHEVRPVRYRNLLICFDDPHRKYYYLQEDTYGSQVAYGRYGSKAQRRYLKYKDRFDVQGTRHDHGYWDANILSFGDRPLLCPDCQSLMFCDEVGRDSNHAIVQSVGCLKCGNRANVTSPLAALCLLAPDAEATARALTELPFRWEG